MKNIYRFLVIVCILILSAEGALAQSVNVVDFSFTIKQPDCANESSGYVVFDGYTVDNPPSPPASEFTFRFNFPPPTSRIFVSPGDTIFNLAAGSYFIEEIDSLYFREDIIINDPPLISTVLFANDPSCFGVCDGTIQALAFGGNQPFTFQFDDPANQSGVHPSRFTATGLCDGVYNVTITDANGCSSTDIDSVKQNPELISNVSVQDVDCFGNGNGKAWVTPTGGTGTYTNFQWQANPSVTDTAFNYVPGTYSVTVTDSDGCTDEEIFTITEPPLLTVSSSQSDAFCAGQANGSITVNTNGGTTPYTFLWSDGNTNEDRPAIGVGTYTLTVTDANGCQVTTTETISEPNPPLSTDTVVTNVSCNGLSDGEILINASGGVPGNRSFSWSGGGTGNPLTGLSAGKYFVTVTNVVGCTKIDSAVVSEPAVLALTETPTNPACVGAADGEIDIEVTGGTPNFIFTWSDIGVGPEDRTNLTAGSYTVVVQDANGCTASITSTLSDPTPILPNVTPTDALCNGDASGTATSAPTGGSGNYVSWDWGTGSGNTTNTETNLTAGTYTVIVTDDEGCTGSQTFTIGEPPLLTVSSSQSDAFCAGQANGSITVNTNGGTTPYTFLWSDGDPNEDRPAIGVGTYTLTVTDANGCQVTTTETISEPNPPLSTDTVVTNVSCNGLSDGEILINVSGGVPGNRSFSWSGGQTGNPLTGLAAGKYFVTVTNVVGCTKIDSAVVSEPAVLSLTETPTDPGCVGGADGEIDIEVTGGTPNYIFTWSDIGVGPEDRTSLTAGSYTVIVQDANGCTASITSTLSDPTPILPNVTTTDALCRNGSSGTATSTPTGGSGNYVSWDWGTGSGNTNFFELNLSAGTYTVTVTDDEGCAGTETFTIGEPATSVSASIVNSADVDCFGNSTGSATAQGSGGTENNTYDFLWSDPAAQTTATAVNLAANTYTVTVTDDNGCTDVASIVISEPAEIAIDLDSTDVSCFNGNDGSVIANISNGTTPYNFIWSDGSSGTGASPVLSGLTQGKYLITVTDANLCTAVDSIIVNEPTDITITSVDTDPLCNGDATGEIDLSVSGGTPGYSFSWSPGGGQIEDTTNLTAGTYTVIVTDGNGCTASYSTTLTDPSNLTVSIDSVRDVSCNGLSDGFIRALANGGTGTYTYDWDNLPATSDPRANDNLPAGSYTVTVTDGNGCTATTFDNVGQPLPLQVSLSKSDASCNGVNDGSVTASGSNGTSPYNYSWSNGQSGPTINTLSAGIYEVTVTDDNGCVVIDNIEVFQPAAITLTTSGTDLICNGDNSGTVSVVANGGSGNYTYLWDDPSNQSTATATNLAANTYTVIVTDANGCNASSSETITEPTLLTASIVNPINPSCNGINDGSISVSANGGTIAVNSDYTYLWSDVSGQTTQTASNLASGPYTVTVSDDNGCTTTASGTLTAPPSVVISLDTVINVSCNGDATGEILISVSGGNPGYDFAWSDGAATSEDRTGLTAGSYTVTATDQSGCIDVQNFTINEPAQALSIQVDSTGSLDCFGDTDGFIAITILGGTPPYNTLWNDGSSLEDRFGLSGGTYDIDVTDDNGCLISQSFTIAEPAQLAIIPTNITNASCSGIASGSATISGSGGTSPYTFNWSNGGSGTSQSGLVAGTYRITLTDANQCENIDSITITQPQSIDFSLDNQDNVSCNGGSDGSITISGLGGTPPYTFDWSTGANNIGASSTISSLPANTYSVTIQDANGCDTFPTFTITEPSLLTVNLNVTNEQCVNANDGEIFANVNGGTPPYNYNWSPSGPNDPTNDNLNPGAYSVIVTDDNGCTATANDVVLAAVPIILTAAASDANCKDEASGSLTAVAMGGAIPYTFDWSDGGSGDIRSGTVTAGNYTVTLTDNNGCTETASATVGEPDTLKPALSITDASCSGIADGSVSSTPTGGTPPFDFDWSNGVSDVNALTSTVNSLLANTYDVTITDANGCDTIVNFTINSGNLNLVYTDSVRNDSCFNECDGFISINVTSGGVGPYNFTWQAGVGSGNLASNLCAGTYSVTVADQNNCDTVLTYTITEPAQILANENSGDESCSPGNDGFAEVNPSGGTGPYTFNWSNGAGNVNRIDNLTANNYSVTITDAFGCSISQSFTINKQGNLNFTDVSNNLTCFKSNDGAISITVSGAVGTPTFQWNPSTLPAQANQSGLEAGTYDVTISDPANGCSATKSYTLTQPDSIEATFVTTSASCVPGNDGTITTTVIGGTAAAGYSYQWSGGSSSKDLTALSAGTYTVTITDDNGCTQIDSATVSGGSSAIVLNEVISNASCNGVCDGSITLNPTNGVAPYSFDWDDGSQQFFLPSLCAGSYDVTVTDDDGCSTTATFSVLGGATITTTIATVADTCLKGVGQASPTSSGGQAPYSYDWSNGTTGPSANGLIANNYDVTVTDDNGCSSIESFTILNEATFTISLTVEDEKCRDANDGRILVSTVGGVNPLTYTWVGPQSISGANPDPVAAGTYFLTVTDNAGCSQLDTAVINQPDAFSETLITAEETCFPGGDGTATITITGGTPPYSYNWGSGFQASNFKGGLVAGFYEVTISDDNGCTEGFDYIITQGSNFNLNSTVTDASCNGGNDGAIDLQINGGTPPFTFNWSGTLPSQEDQTNLTAGNYTVTVIDNTPCSEVLSFRVEEDIPIEIDIKSNPESCVPGGDGSAVATVTGGVQPYSYDWSNGTPFLDSVADLSAGAYVLTVTDNNGCTQTKGFPIQSGSNITANETINEPSCFGGSDGSISLSPTGSSNPNPSYTYVWFDGSTSGTITGLSRGSYSVTISDNNAPPCTKTEVFTVNQPTNISTTISSTFESCSPGNDATATASTVGATPPYTYLWPGGGTTSNSKTGFASGSYDVTVQDANGCTRSFPFNVDPAPPFNVSLTSTDATCNGGVDGTITVSVSGARNPLTYDWSGGLSGGATPTMVGAGTYTVTVEDGLGCTQTATTSVSEAAPIISNLAPVDENCNSGGDGSATVNPSNGNAPYSVTWSTGATGNSISSLSSGSYSVTITDATPCSIVENFTISTGQNITLTDNVNNASCNGLCDGDISLTASGGQGPYIFDWGGGVSGTQRTSLCAGDYTVTVTDITGCSKIETYTITEPDTIGNTITTSDESCNPGNDGSASITTIGGTSPYSYDWSNGTQGSNLNPAAAGSYTVTVTDVNGCSKIENFTINLASPLTINLVQQNNVSCNGANDGDVFITVTGNVGVIDYSWNNGQPPFKDALNLSPNTYTVTVTDRSNGCTATRSFVVTEPAPITVSTVINPESCIPGGDGSITLNPTGGTVSLDYTYEWGGSLPDQATVSGLNAGVYTYTVTDDNGCSTSNSVTLNTSAPFSLDSTITNVDCFGGSDGSIGLSVTGANGTPSFFWSNSLGTNATVSNLQAGTYTVTVTDPANGCTETAKISIEEPDSIDASFIVINESCSPGSDGSLTVTPSGGTPPYTYNWFNSSSNATVDQLSAGNYALTISDDNGCSNVFTANVGSSAPFTLTDVVTDASCNGVSNGSILLNVSGASGTLSYQWTNPLPNTNNPTGLAAGTYDVTVTDNGSGCSSTASYVVNEPGAINLTTTTTDASCVPGSDGVARVIATGGQAPYTYAWSTGSNNANIFLLNPGTYTVTVTDNNSCTAVTQATVNSSPPFTIVTDQVDDVSCNSGSDGRIFITINGSGGLPTFQWSNSSNLEDQSGLSAGTYTVTVTDPNTGCTGTESFDVLEPNAITASTTTTNSSCNSCDGTASLFGISGGTGNVTVTWLDASKVSIGQSGINATSLCAGNYFAALEDQNNCTDTLSVQVVDDNAPPATVSSISESCLGAADGEVSVTSTCISNSNCTVEWRDNSGSIIATTPIVQNLSSGTYFVEITETSTNCVNNLQTTIGSGSEITPNLTTKNNDCSALTVCTGYAKVEPSGGIAPYTFDWAESNGTPIAGNDSIGSLCAGSYNLTITDNAGCDTIISFNINQGGSILPNETVLQESCPGACDGSITLAPSGGQTPYSYNWSNGAGNVDRIIDLCSGVYTVTVTDNANCDTVISVAITSTSFTYTKSKTDESCFGPCDGTASIQVNGGSTGFNFNWSPTPINGQGTESVTDLCAGKYFVTITSNTGCSEIDSVEILPNSTIQPNEVFIDESCSGACDGRIELNPSGGAGAPYSFNWSPVPPNGQGNSEAIDLCGNTYNVTITDALGCDTSISITIQSAPQLQANVTVVGQSCGGPSAPCDGEASILTSGGAAPYTYNWSTGTVVGANQDTIENVCAGGPYDVTVTDANGCSVIEPFSILSPIPIAATFNTIDATCNVCDGSITATVSGPTPNFTYEWFDQGLNPIGNNSTSISSLCSGIYFLEVTDANGCSERFSTNINDIGSESLTVNSTDVSCSGSCDGSASVSFNCNGPSCSVEWFNASTGITLGITSNTVNNLCAGDYFVEVINNTTGCKSFETVTINQPDAFDVRETIVATNCANTCDGSISLIVNGASSPYSFVWSPAPANGQGTNSVSGLCAGSYSVRIEDASGCDTTLTYSVGGPTDITATFNTLDATCGLSDGIISATVSGGTTSLGYSYQWFDASNVAISGATVSSLSNVGAGTYFLEVTDDNGCQKTFTTTIGTTNGPTITLESITNLGCEGDNSGAIDITVSGNNPPYTFDWLPFGQASEDLSNLTAGVYEVLVTNSQGCASRDTFVVSEPAEILANINTLDANCGFCDGEADISVSGGIQPYTYLWSNGSTSNDATALCSGTQSVEVTDANGCKKSFNFSINSTGGPDDAIVSATPASCQTTCDGTASVQAVGGTAPYSYLWLHNGSTANSLTSLCEGVYTIQITDASGCVFSKSVDIPSPSTLTANEIVSNNQCNAFPCEGTARLNVNGGTSPYSYSWSSDPSNNSNFEDELCAGTYFVTVTDNNGCSLIKAVTISDSDFPVSAQPSTIDASCFGSCDGSLISNLSPSSAYDYQWFDQNGNSVSSLNANANDVVCPGEYVLEITAKPSGCKSYFNASVGEPDEINIGATVINNISCAGSCDGEIFVSTTGGSLLYSYSWNDPEQQSQVPASGLCEGDYTVTATDANGCSAITTITLTDPPSLGISVLSSTSLDCSSDCDASASVSANGGIPPYTFSWNGGQTGANPTNLCFGPNVVTVEDAVGCQLSTTVLISATDTIEAIIPSQTQFCDGDSIRLLGSSMGSSISTVAWYEGNTSNFFTSNLDTTIYRPIGNHPFYLIAAGNGTSCTDTSLYEVEIVANPSLSLSPSAQLIRDEVLNIDLGGQDPSYLYNWTPGTMLSDSSTAEPIASPRETITYTLTVTDTNGCVFIDSIRVSYVPDIEIPSGFTPNGDGVNDVWNIELLEEFPKAKVQIFSRWGELLYEQNNGYVQPWDGTYKGKAMPVGTYYYIIDLKVDKIDPVTGPITIVK
ncbi:MAG: gliding motility-associated C-terminal domain-containing protein [Vicingaceae bacterium]